MGISYAGVDLLLADQDGRLQGFIDRYIPFEEMSWRGRQSAALESDTQSCQRHIGRVNMPVFNWPDPPRPKLNTLYYPVTGATRWSYFFALADTKRLESILKSDVKKNGASLVLRLNSDSNTQPDFSMWMYPLTTIPFGKGDLAILPLVDRRYFWQFQTLDPVGNSSDETWSDVLDTVMAISSYSEIDSDWGHPDPVEFGRTLNLALAVDAIAASLGRRAVFAWDDDMNCNLQTPDDANQTLRDNLDGGYQKRTKVISENSTDAHIYANNKPANIEVAFPIYRGQLAHPDGKDYVQTVSANGTDGVQQDGTAWRVTTTAAADLTGLEDNDSPRNVDTCNALADAIRNAYFGWQDKSHFDNVGAGTSVPRVDGFYDMIVIDAQQGTTRFTSLPPDVFPSTNWCQIDCVYPWPGPTLRVVLTEPLYGCGEATAKVKLLDSCGSQSPEEEEGSQQATIRVSDPLNTVANCLLAIGDSDVSLYVPAGTCAYVKYFHDSQTWEPYAFGLGCDEGSGSEGSDDGSSGSEEGIACVTPESRGLDGIPGYDNTAHQVLMHENGCLRWINIADCDNAASGSIG